MSQGKRDEPENPLGNYALSKEAVRFRTMEIYEHAALVQAIMINFPEIYEKSGDSKCGRQFGGHGATEPRIQPPTLA